MDTHCGTTVQGTSFGACHPEAGSIDASGAIPDAALGPDGGVLCTTYGATMDNAEGDDDDCKYHIKWTASAVCESSGVYFTVTAIHKTDLSPLTGADPFAEVFLNPTHPGDISKSIATEGPMGTYKIGPVYFDASGQWTVRFHFYHECADLLPTSPHGHAAFYLHVP